ncbi:discoidin domain-containing protein [Paenibacillus sp. GCM10012307]|uniref:Discoidin domain-containing protein n=1 Tax=Paenibacillus roseus TaxID=2798579 RepID=A0A934MQK7_9BACL|nr:discoidin domain-containing protein [Paenibacillus roseus]MBJ6361464.1 discoidin domain-containing protein [Paenibacillus roseus]
MEIFKGIKRVSALALALTLAGGGSIQATPASPAPVRSDSEWTKLQSVISKYYGEWNDTSYKGLFVTTIPKTALLGNGDIGVTSGGDEVSKSFYISKGDFWAYHGSPMPIGGLTIQKKSTASQDQDPQKTSLAYRKQATSSADHYGSSASRAVNGEWAADYEGWVSPVGNGQWLAVDLGEAQTFNRFVVRHDAAARPNETVNITQSFKLQTSTDGNVWRDAYMVTGNQDAITDIILPAPITARYVRLYIIKGTQETTDDSRQYPRARIGQFELYMNPDLTPQTPQSPEWPQVSLTLGQPATASGSHYSLTPDRAVNGSWSANSGYEGWTSGYRGDGQPGPWWLEVDLGEKKPFNRFVVRHDGAARPWEAENNTKEFQLQARNTTDSDWENVYTVENNSAATTDIKLDSTTEARYVRLFITKGTQGNTQDSQENPRARIGQFELFNETVDNGSGTTGEAVKMYDLGQSSEISRYVVRLSRAKDVTVEASEDSSTWHTVGQTTGNSSTVVVDVTTDPFTARYVRVKADEPVIISASLLTVPGLVKQKPEGKLHEIQDILNAEIRTETELGELPLEMRTWASAVNNVIVTELTSRSNEAVELQAQVWAKAGNAKLPVTATQEANSAVVTRQTTIESQDRNDVNAHISKAALASKIIGVNGVELATDAEKGTGNLNFTLAPNQTVYVVTAVGGGGRTYNYQGALLQDAEPQVQALRLLNSVNTLNDVQALHGEHLDWWKQFWLDSYVLMDTSDPELDSLMKFYYSGQYYLGASIREGKVAPGLYGQWHTTDSSQWNSDYHMNYNFIAPFYGVNSSNRTWMGKPAIDAILDYVPNGLKNAASTDHLMNIGHGDHGAKSREFVQMKISKGVIDPVNGISDALLYPVSIGPWGMGLAGEYGYYGQLLDAIFSTYPFIEYYNYTQDETFLPTMYTFLKQSIALYEAWLEKEGDEYVLYSAYNEGSWGKNSAVELAMLKNALIYAIQASEKLDEDPVKREQWKNILEHLAPQPTAQYKGKKIYSLAEKHWNNNQWENLSNPIPWDGNILPLENVIPGEQLGYYSSAEDLQIAKDTIDVFIEEGVSGGRNGVWSQSNNFPKIFANAVNVRFPIETIVKNFAKTIEEQIQKNLTIMDNDDAHGVEKSGATEAINNMMLLSDQGIMKVFPNWLADKDASFARLREKGAFVVSAAYSGAQRQVQHVEIVSEAGKTASIASPWAEGLHVVDADGNVVPTIKGTAPNHETEVVYTFNTVAGMTYHLLPVAPSWPADSALTASQVGRNSLTLSWTDAQDAHAVTEYRVYRGDNLLATVPADVKRYEVTGLSSGTKYTFKIEAGNGAGKWSVDGPSVKVTTSSSYSGGSNPSAPATPENPDSGEVRPDGTIVADKPKFDKDTGLATVTIGDDAWKQAAKASKHIKIEVPVQQEATGYTVILPADALASGEPAQDIELVTGIGTIRVSSKMWSKAEVNGKREIALSLRSLSAERLEADARKAAGGRPVLELTAQIDGKAVEWSNPDFPVTLSVPYKPAADELATLEQLAVRKLGGAGKMTPVPTGSYDTATGTVSWQTAQLGTYAVVHIHTTFNDLEKYDWARHAVEVMAAKGVVIGKAEGSYAPAESVKRADFLLLLTRALGLSAKTEGDSGFSDVNGDAYYAEAVAVARKLGIVSGTGQGNFLPEQPVTRQEMMTMMYRALTAAKKTLDAGGEADLAGFADEKSLSSYARSSVAALVKSGIVQGDGQQLSPLASATRAEAAVLIYRLYNQR